MIDQTISHYRVVEKLGGGGIGQKLKGDEAAQFGVFRLLDRAHALQRPDTPPRPAGVGKNRVEENDIRPH